MAGPYAHNAICRRAEEGPQGQRSAKILMPSDNHPQITDEACRDEIADAEPALRLDDKLFNKLSTRYAWDHLLKSGQPPNAGRRLCVAWQQHKAPE